MEKFVAGWRVGSQTGGGRTVGVTDAVKDASFKWAY